MQLPPTLRYTLETFAANFSRKELESASCNISKRYRRLEKAEMLLAINSSAEAMAYGATRLPATYSAISKVLQTIKHGLPDFFPVSVMDVGAGPATATFAALEQYVGLTNITLIEPNPHLRQLGEKLLHAIHQELQPQWLKSEITSLTLERTYDLVVCGYVLNEIEEEKGKNAVETTIKKLWQATEGTLVIIEPGTPVGYANLMRIRQWLIDAGAWMVAPCPHIKPCSLLAKIPEKWCHFSVRVERSKLHRGVKQDATLPYEDEKFSYLVFSRQQPQTPEYRLIGRTCTNKGVEADACIRSGEVKHLKIFKSHPYYKAFRKAQWGDGI